jgi:BirA family biotin operon repressor/biotin-[acetyl-CoA-carboxylase] ligase
LSTFDVYNQTHLWCLNRGIPVAATSSTGSTNDDAKEMALEVTAPLKVFLTGQQTRGRGRGKNQWTNCGSGNQLLNSWVFELSLPPQHITAPLVGLAICQSLTEAWPELPFGIKPPNDIFVHQRKLCGILVETISTSSRHKLIVGFGLNVFSHPQMLLSSTHLHEFTSISPEKWEGFLNVLFVNLTNVIKKVTSVSLAPTDCQLLCEYINRSQVWPNEVTQVSPEGSLVSTSHSIDWRDL